MKNLFLVLFLITCTFGYSQRGGGGGGRSGGGNQQSRPSGDDKGSGNIDFFKESDVPLEAGFIYYNVETVIKESKAKTKEDKDTISILIEEYNHDLKQIEKSNKLLLDSASLTTMEREKKAIASKDVKEMMESKKYLREKLEPIRKENLEIEKVFLAKMEEKLTAKTHKKWQKYFESNKEKLLPKPPKQEGERTGGHQGGMR